MYVSKIEKSVISLHPTVRVQYIIRYVLLLLCIILKWELNPHLIRALVEKSLPTGRICLCFISDKGSGGWRGILYHIRTQCIIQYMYVHTRRTYALGWVNLYLKKLKLKNIVFVVNSFYPKKMERHLKKKIYWHNRLCEFAWICEYLKASCLQHF